VKDLGEKRTVDRRQEVKEKGLLPGEKAKLKGVKDVDTIID
jgi:hypothetical protein